MNNKWRPRLTNIGGDLSATTYMPKKLPEDRCRYDRIEKEQYLQARFRQRVCFSPPHTHHSNDRHFEDMWTYKTEARAKKVMGGLVASREFIDEGVWHEMRVRSDPGPAASRIHRKDSDR